MLVTAALALGGCAKSSTGAPASQGTKTTSAPTIPTPTLPPAQRWAAQHASTFTTLGGDLGNIAKDATAGSSSGDYSALDADCSTLGSDVASAKGLPPIPAPTPEGQWTSILSNLASASQDCTNGIAQSDVGLISQMSTEITAADGEINSLASSLGLG